jgi:putative transposase
MAQNCSTFSVMMMSQLLDVSRSGYYDWKKRSASRRERFNRILLRFMRAAFRASGDTYGAPRLHRSLRRAGFQVGIRRVRKLMKTAGIRPISQKKFKVKTTDSNHRLPVSANLVNRNFQMDRPNRVWVSDITYIRTRRGFAYLCVIVDLYSRRIVGWSIRENMKVGLLKEALHMALSRRKPKPWSLILHSDRGSQYASRSFRAMLKEHGIISSMSATGDCFDNAVAESVFATIKTERVHTREYQNLTEARMDLFQYIEGFYNRRRMHSFLDYMSPEEFESQSGAA